jgi:type I restriction-modification system DNA methylase subunit
MSDAANKAAFRKELERMTPNGGSHLRDVFDDFLFMASTAFRQATHMFRTREVDVPLEASLHVLKSRYAIPNEFGNALAIMSQAIGTDMRDFLGEFYMENDLGNAKSGQFFTPHAVSEMCARMTVTRESYEEHLAKGKRLKISDCAVGGGSMLIPIAKMMREWDAHPSTWMFDVTDVDLRCVRMCYIQLTLLHAPAFVRHGNSLSLEMYDCWPTLAMAMNPPAFTRDGIEETSGTAPTTHELGSMATIPLPEGQYKSLPWLGKKSRLAHRS